MIDFLNKIQSAVRNRTTYRVGLLQAKTYRILKSATRESLSKYNISTIDWALLGLLYVYPNGMRASHLAAEIGVEASFVTVLFNDLKKKGVLDSKSDPKDSRVKIIYLTSKGRDFVDTVEGVVRVEVKRLLSGISPSDIVSYVTVLEKIIENSKKSLSVIH